jgi:hypothetical protein
MSRAGLPADPTGHGRQTQMHLLIDVLAAAILLFAASLALGAMPTTLLDDRDWRAPAAATHTEGIEREMTPALLLKTEFKEPVFLFDPTDDETITAVTGFRRKLYLASCTRPSHTDTGSVFAYDPETHRWQKSFQVDEQGIVRFELYGDRLYIAGYDSNEGREFGNIYVHDGATWVKHRTVPRAIHEYGLAVYRDRIYVSAAITHAPPAGMTIDEAVQKELAFTYGRVMSSGDGGVTWREEYHEPRPGQEVGFMTVWRDRLILNAQGDLIVFDGEQWRPLGLNPNCLIVFDYTDAGDFLVLGTPFGLGFYDGERFGLARGDYPLAHGNQVRSVVRFGEHWLVLSSWIPGATTRHGPGGTGYLRFDAIHETILLAVPDREFREAAHGRWQRRMWDRVAVINTPSEDMAVSAHAFKGRLYLGTHPRGRVFVLPVAKEGTLDSMPRAVPAGSYTLSWEAATPAGTSCRFQIRTAATKEAIEKAPFIGADGKESSFFDTPGARFTVAAPGYLQYRVTLRTENPALTPYLKRVTIWP